MRVALGPFNRWERYGDPPRALLARGTPDYNSDFFFNPTVRKDAMARFQSLVERFKDDPTIDAWVVTNEPRLIADPESAIQRRSWHDWLARRYGTVENIAKAWKQHPPEGIQAIQQIPILRLHDRSPRSFDEARWIDEVLIAYVRDVARAIRSWDRNHLITMDGCSWSYWLMRDWARLPEIDFVSWHDYDWSASEMYCAVKMVCPPDKPLMVTESRAAAKYAVAGLMGGAAAHLNFSSIPEWTLYRRRDAPRLHALKRWTDRTGIGTWNRDRPRVAIRIDYRGPQPIEVSDFSDHEQPQMRRLYRLAKALGRMGVRFDVVDEKDDKSRYALVFDVDRHTAADADLAQPFKTLQADFPGWKSTENDPQPPFVWVRRNGPGDRVAAAVVRFHVGITTYPPDSPPAPFAVDMTFTDLAERRYTATVTDLSTGKVILAREAEGPTLRVAVKPGTLGDLLLVSVLPIDDR